MAGRYKLDSDWTEIVRVFRLDLCEPLDVVPRFNVAPTMRMPVVLLDEERRVSRWMQKDRERGAGAGEAGRVAERRYPVRLAVTT